MTVHSDKVAIVTGGARGIGRASALDLAGRGFSIVVVDRLPEEMAATAADIQKLGRQCTTIDIDVSDFAAVQKAGEDILARYGRVDVLVNNAGIGQPNELATITEAEWDQTLDINLKGFFNWCKAAAPALIASGDGRIVNISSINAYTGGGKHASKLAYAAAKAGILGLTRALARELAPNVTVNAICPGAIETDLTRERWKPYREKLVETVPAGRLGTPEDIAVVVGFLATVTPNYITGEAIVVDGGRFVSR